MSSKMLRFFSRRKIKGGRAEQKAGVGGRRAPGRLSKHALPCNIMLLDGSDLALEIGVSFPPFLASSTHLSGDWQGLTLPALPLHMNRPLLPATSTAHNPLTVFSPFSLSFSPKQLNYSSNILAASYYA